MHFGSKKNNHLVKVGAVSYFNCVCIHVCVRVHACMCLPKIHILELKR